MKNTFSLILACFILQGCCVFTSQDCGCNPPAPQFLNDEVKEWMLPFENATFQVFEDENGNMDSIEIERITSATLIGGDECGADSELERALLQFNQSFNRRLAIEATEQIYIRINFNEDKKDYLQASLNTQNNNISVSNENTMGTIDDAFDWNGETISVLIVDCRDSSDCFDYQMRRYIISKELGLLEYVDYYGITWKRIN